MIKYAQLEKLAGEIRKNILQISYDAKVGHVGSAFSIVEILVALYFGILKIDQRRPNSSSRDRFILSKGHAAPALYCVLEKRGLITKKILTSYCRDGGLLEEHPTHHINGIEVSTGSLGHGLSIGVGFSLAAKLKKANYGVFVLISDAELDEGETWAAALSAAHHKLDNLTILLDYNQVQALGRVHEVLNIEPLKEKWLAFGWRLVEVDGHNIRSIIMGSQRKTNSSQPSIIICHTIRGKGVSFMEHKIEWHYLSPTADHIKRALRELR